MRFPGGSAGTVKEIYLGRTWNLETRNTTTRATSPRQEPFLLGNSKPGCGSGCMHDDCSSASLEDGRQLQPRVLLAAQSLQWHVAVWPLGGARVQWEDLRSP